MAEITGLSQSQVYKWCWDQKKKQNRAGIDFSKSILDRKKIIKKHTNYREDLPDKYSKYEEENED